jgi:predicted ribosome quality control (RQC) complex YloA/Tae2 family protein
MTGPHPTARPRSMTAVEIAAAVAELAPDVVGGVVTRVREPWPEHLVLEVRKGGRNVEVVFGVAPGLARVHRAADLPPAPPRSPCGRASSCGRPGWWPWRRPWGSGW